MNSFAYIYWNKIGIMWSCTHIHVCLVVISSHSLLPLFKKKKKQNSREESPLGWFPKYKLTWSSLIVLLCRGFLQSNIFLLIVFPGWVRIVLFLFLNRFAFGCQRYFLCVWSNPHQERICYANYKESNPFCVICIADIWWNTSETSWLSKKVMQKPV